MAVWIRHTPYQAAAHRKWVSRRPLHIRKMLETYNLDHTRMYRLKSTGVRVMLYALSGNNTVVVNVLEEYNPETMPRMGGIFNQRVFGIDPAQLTECELLEGVEAVDGTPLHEKYMEKHLSVMRFLTGIGETTLKELTDIFRQQGYSRSRAKRRACLMRGRARELIADQEHMYYDDRHAHSVSHWCGRFNS